VSELVVTDPTLMRPSTLVCVKCHSTGGVIIQAKSQPTDDKIKLINVCSNPECLHKWQT